MSSLMTRKAGWNAISASPWMAGPKPEIDMLTSRAVIERSFSRLKKPVDRSLNKFKGKRKLHL